MFKELGSSGLGKYSEEYPVTTFEREVSAVFVRLLDVLLGCGSESGSNCVPRFCHAKDEGFKGLAEGVRGTVLSLDVWPECRVKPRFR